MVSLHKDEEEPNESPGTDAPHSSEPQKAHPTGKFVVML